MTTLAFLKSPKILLPFVPCLLGCSLVVYGEWSHFERNRALEEGARIALELRSAKPSDKNEGKLVFVSGLATTEETLGDTAFGVEAKALRLERMVQEFRVVTTTDSKGSRHETKVWREWKSRTTSSPDFPYPPQARIAEHVTLGDFQLTERQVERINDWRPLRPTTLPEGLSGGARRVQLTKTGFYFGTPACCPRRHAWRPQAPQCRPHQAARALRSASAYEPNHRDR